MRKTVQTRGATSVEADGVVTPDEHALVSAITQRLGMALQPFTEDAADYRVVVVPQAGVNLDALKNVTGIAPGTLGKTEVLLTASKITEPVAQQYAKELRERGFLAMAVKNVETQT